MSVIEHTAPHQALTESSRRSLGDVWVVIPAHNEESSLALVLADLPAVGRVIVVDNASTDRTAHIARSCGARVVDESRKGYGSACLAGLAEIARIEQSGGRAPSIVVFLDADYSDHPDLLPELVAPIFDGAADFVLGSRLLGDREVGAMPPQSVYGNRLACWLIRRFWGEGFTDLGPFRAISYSALKRLEMGDRNFGWTVEMQVKAALQGLRSREIPVPYRRRIGHSKISGTVRGTIMAGTKILFTISKYAWQTRCWRSSRVTPRAIRVPQATGCSPQKAASTSSSRWLRALRP